MIQLEILHSTNARNTFFSRQLQFAQILGWVSSMVLSLFFCCVWQICNIVKLKYQIWIGLIVELMTTPRESAVHWYAIHISQQMWNPTIYIWVYVFRYPVWFSTAVSVIGIGLLIAWFGKKSLICSDYEKKKGLARIKHALFFSYGSVMQQGKCRNIYQKIGVGIRKM